MLMPEHMGLRLDNAAPSRSAGKTTLTLPSTCEHHGRGGVCHNAHLPCPFPTIANPLSSSSSKKKRLIHSKASHGHLFQLGTWRIDAFFVTKQNQSAAPCLNSHPSLPPSVLFQSRLQAGISDPSINLAGTAQQENLETL